VNGIGIDWDGEDDVINEEFYVCKKGKTTNLENENPKSNKHCEKPPAVRKCNLFLNTIKF
jgi:hypothetical protein